MEYENITYLSHIVNIFKAPEMGALTYISLSYRNKLHITYMHTHIYYIKLPLLYINKACMQTKGKEQICSIMYSLSSWHQHLINSIKAGIHITTPCWWLHDIRCITMRGSDLLPTRSAFFVSLWYHQPCQHLFTNHLVRLSYGFL